MTLTQATRNFRLMVKILGLVFGSLFVLRVMMVVYNFVFPTTPPTPPSKAFTATFGQIPPLTLEIANAQFTSNYTSRLDLFVSDLPQEPQVAYIYPVLKAPYGFLSEDRARQVATAFKFTSSPIKLSINENAWRAPNQILTVNSQNLNYKYEYKYLLDTSVFVTGRISSSAQVITEAIALNKSTNIFGTYADNLSTTEPNVSLLKFQNLTLQPTNSISDTVAARVDFSRTSVEFDGVSYPFVNPNYTASPTYMLFAASEGGSGIRPIEAQYILWRYLANQGSTYPMINSQVAWENIQRNPKLFTVYVGNLTIGPMDKTTTTPVISNLAVRSVSFAYYNTKVEQDYIQPVWVFIGKATLQGGGELDWVGYVPAIRPDYVDQTQGSTVQNFPTATTAPSPTP